MHFPCRWIVLRSVPLSPSPHPFCRKDTHFSSFSSPFRLPCVALSRLQERLSSGRGDGGSAPVQETTAAWRGFAAPPSESDGGAPPCRKLRRPRETLHRRPWETPCHKRFSAATQGFRRLMATEVVAVRFWAGGCVGQWHGSQNLSKGTTCTAACTRGLVFPGIITCSTVATFC